MPLQNRIVKFSSSYNYSIDIVNLQEFYERSPIWHFTTDFIQMRNIFLLQEVSPAKSAWERAQIDLSLLASFQ